MTGCEWYWTGYCCCSCFASGVNCCDDVVLRIVCHRYAMNSRIRETYVGRYDSVTVCWCDGMTVSMTDDPVSTPKCFS